MTFRWTPEAVAEHEERMARLKESGAVRTHRIGGRGEVISTEKNRRGGRKSKYGNIKTEAEGMKFASRKEAKRWMELRLREKAGEIQSLQRQVTYPLEVNGLKICDYIADFVYRASDAVVIEDSKGYRTTEYRLKAKLMLAVHGVTVLET